ncbi:1-aminocyclopropane-1-carboxylate oxidase 5 [Cinnamomum micranthum f. kanehirae]|uniref:aminocyclopropanecarboxylate oxidase n=1 Tax=Cinnamomum micranthum f. kanehirae TaxID=337451 RepID=A0A3S3MLJ8_9MAGN|nr:1-aminocyclopropane-1-carboxylate oxidase 5 [Cinnamomum micranthum f. kanehirae]
MAVPVIDMSMLDGDDRAQTMAKIANGCEEWGFFQLINHGIPVELLDRVKKVCSECFKLYREQRFKDSAPVQLLNDLMGGKKDEAGERLKNTDWEDVFVLHDTNEWPSQPAEFKETMKEYRRELKKLAEKMMEIMDENLGLEKGYIKKVFCGGEGLEHEPFFGTKVSHYPPCPNPDQVIGLRAHTDAGGVILLFQDDKVKGLQILKDGEWIDVQPMANAIVINTGDQIEVVSNGRYKSVWHREIHCILSTIPQPMATMTPAPKLVGQTDEDAQAYPKFVFGDYMTVYGDQKFLPKEPRFKAAGAM